MGDVLINILSPLQICSKVERGNFGHMRNSGQRRSKAKSMEQCGYNCSFSTRSS